MIWSKAKLSPELRSLLESERRIGGLPAATRTRAISRARAALAAGVATRLLPARPPSAVRWVVAAGLACMATVATAAAAYNVGVRARPAGPPVEAAASGESAAPHRRAGGEPMLDLDPSPLPEATPGRSRALAVRMELRLLRQARAAVAREDFTLAIQLLAEHARRFKAGRLVEEREALRVKSLAGLGRHVAARRAAADFQVNFPRSPLLPTVNEMLDSMP
jgi:hypothetical protein